MGKDHLKRIASPKTWPIARKANKYIARPKSGKRMELSLPLATVLKEVIGVADTTKQVKSMLLNKRIIVDGVARRDHRYPVGLFDVIELPEAKKSYRLVLNQKGKLATIEIDQKEKDLKLQQVVGKQIVKGGKLQLAFQTGRIKSVEEIKSDVNVGDSVILDEKKAISKHFAFKEGMYVQFIGGRHIGGFGSIKKIDGQKVTVESEGSEFETLKKYAFILGEKNSEVKVNE